MRTDKSVQQKSNDTVQTRGDNSRYIKQDDNYLHKGNTQQAVDQFNQAINEYPDSADLYSERANFRYKRLGDTLGAIEDYSQAICMQPENSLFYLWRSQAYNDLGESQKSIADYNTAIKLSPENTIYYFF
jgi:tetratricopeptide (TPR) repeat protein